MSTLKSYKEWTGPYFEEYIAFSRLSYPRNPDLVDEKTCDLLELLFSKFHIFKNMSEYEDQETFTFYFRLPKGSAEEYRSYEDIKEDYNFKSKIEYIKQFDKWFRRKWYWFKVDFIRSFYNDDTYYLICFNGRMYFYAYDGKGKRKETSEWEYDYSPFITPLLPFADDLVKQASSPDYSIWINTHLDYRLRNGYTKYKYYWEIYPKEKKEYLKIYEGINIEKFINAFKSGLMGINVATRFDRMTANKYCEIFKIASDAIGLPYHDELSLQENFHYNSDGRNNGLNTIDSDSFVAFDEWYEKMKYHFDHTFEIRNRYGRIDLDLLKYEKDYYISICGGDFYSGADVMRIYLALKEKGINAYIYNPKEFIDNYYGNSFYHARGEDNYVGNFPKTKIKEYIRTIAWDPLSIIELN